MSTEIKSPEGGRVRIEPSIVIEGGVFVVPDMGPGTHLARADLLAAVAKECGVIVIERAGGEPLAEWGEEILDYTPKELAWHAVLRAVNAWEKTPEIDEAQVEALTESLVAINKDAPDGEWWAQWAARRLIADGWTRP